MIKVDKLSKSYGPVQALKGISFEVGRGEIIGLLGPNGAGKTTTMKILTGYLQPSEGSAVVHGIDVVSDPIAARTHIGYLPENAPLYLDMAVQEYLLMMADLRQIPAEARIRLISEAVYATGLDLHLTRPIGDLSKGFRQRVGLAQAIMHKPKVLILDEPTNGLDPTQIVEIRDLIRRIAETATVIVSTHILSEVEATAHRAIIIMGGQIKADAKLDELRASTTARVAIEKSATDVQAALSAIPGVSRVAADGASTAAGTPSAGSAWGSWRVTSGQDLELCPLIYDVARARGWRLGELRQERRTLESVFRELADKEGVRA